MLTSSDTSLTLFGQILVQFFFWFFCFFSYLGFLSQPFTNHRTAGKGGGNFFNSSLPLPTASQTLRHQPGDYCRELTSAHRQQPDSNRQPLVSERKLLTTKQKVTFPHLSNGFVSCPFYYCFLNLSLTIIIIN